MSKYCTHCHDDFKKGWVVEFERTGYCANCVSLNAEIRQAAQNIIQRREMKPAHDAMMKTLYDAFADGGSLRIEATHAATFLSASELNDFILGCENAITSIRRSYAIPRFGFGGKDTDDVLSRLNCIRVMKEALNAKHVIGDRSALLMEVAA